MPSTLDALVARAVTGAAAADTNEEWEAVWSTLAPVRGLGSDAYRAAVGMLDGSATEQRVGCMLLRVGFVADEEWQDRAVAAILAMAARRPDDVTLDLAAAAFGDFGLPAGLPLLLKLSRHADEQIRLSAVAGIPSCCGPDYRGIPAAVNALLERMTDEDDDVRDWATFGIGSRLDDDSTAIRDALAARLEDAFPEVRHEAITGLARRRDPRAIAPTLAELGGEFPRRTIVEAAEYLASHVLLPALLALADR
jgi:HEAT repeat protein